MIKGQLLPFSNCLLVLSTIILSCLSVSLSCPTITLSCLPVLSCHAIILSLLYKHLCTDTPPSHSIISLNIFYPCYALDRHSAFSTSSVLVLPCHFQCFFSTLSLFCIYIPSIPSPCLPIHCLVLPCLVLPCLVLPCLVLPCLALYCLALPSLVFSYFLLFSFFFTFFLLFSNTTSLSYSQIIIFHLSVILIFSL